MSSEKPSFLVLGIPVKTVLKKALILVIVGILLGWAYAWASPHVFPRETDAGFGYGVAHGALMPMALPSLLLGKNVEIYATKNLGRFYKIGYIVGINLCGLIFFGSAFARPRRKKPASAACPAKDQNSQFR